MDINKLKQLIKDSLKGDVFTLNTSILLSPDITAIATDYFPDATLKLSAASIPPPDDESITVVATGADTPFNGLAVKAMFYILDGNAALTLTAAGDSSWTLEKSIPVFKDTLGASIRFAVTPVPPTLSLLSNRQDEKNAGLSFDGNIDFSKMSYGISTLLGIKEQNIAGPIVLKAGGTAFVSIDFKGPNVKNVNLFIAKDCTVQFNMGDRSLPNPATKTTVPLPYIELVTDIPFKASGNEYSLPVSVQVINLNSSIRFSADITGVVDATLDALDSFLGGAGLARTIPSNYHISDILKFTALYFDFDVKGTKVTRAGLQVKSVNKWPILTVASTGKTFSAENMKLDFLVLTPFNGGKPYLNLGGDITLIDGKAWLFVSAAYPDFQIQGYLTENSVLSIKEFVAQFVGEPVGIPEDLFIDELAFNLQADDYSFAINSLGYWPINPGQNLSLIIDQLGFSVNYTSAKQTAKFSGEITVGPVNIYITAGYSASKSGKGWLFTGKTGKGQLIFIGEFIAYLTETFRVGKPPKWIEGITLQDLDTSFNTLTKDCSFSVIGNIPLANGTLQIMVGFEMTAVKKGIGYEKVLTGTLTLNEKHVFELKFTTSPSDTNISATWETAKEADYLKFKDIATAFGLGDNFPEIPEGLDLALKKATLFYDFTDKKQALVLSAESANYGKAVFVAKKIDDAWTYVFGIDVKVNVNLDQLPLVGSNLVSIVGPIGLNGFKLVGTSKEIIDKNVPGFNDLIKAHAVEGSPTLPDIKEGIQKGLYAAIDLDLGNDNSYEVQVSTAKKDKKTGLGLMVAEDKPVKDDNTYWVTLEKTIGPVYFEKAGVGYKDGRVTLMLNASLVFTALKIDLIELGVSNPLTEIKPEFGLSGLSISYQSGPVQIAAGFLKHKVGEITEYAGTAIVGIKAFNLSALGSYASVDGHPSLFIFAMLTSPPLGGPPAFFVTGIAAGFGYNRGLRLPSIDTVTKFPLVSGFVPKQDSPFSGPDPGAALKVLMDDDVVPISIGQNWLAAGVQFTSFELIQSFALLAVAFGTDLEIGLIGLATISVPPKIQPPVAFAQLALSVKILPNEGLVAVDAKLTPASYLLSQACLLTGGFAFYLWTAPNEHEGDFVVTLGGYHPNFVPPDHYPKVPRLGFNWVVNKEVLIKGGMYFALTPTCVMVGGSLEATFTSGDLHAWFTIGADFLIAWKPYYYTAHMYLSFGVSYTFSLDLLFTTITETISVSLGADLNVWGPEFSGVAQIHLWIISFDISFGSTPNTPPAAIKWADFKESFLPPSEKTRLHEASGANADEPVPTDTYCKAQVARGLVKDLTKETENDAIDMSWIVNRNLTTLDTNTIFPAKDYKLIICGKDDKPIPVENLVYTNKAALDARNLEFGVGLVEVENEDFHSEHVVTIKYHGNLNPLIKYEVTAIIRGVPKSLWQKRETGFDDNAIVPNVLVGFSISPIAPTPSSSVPIDLEYFKYRQQPYVPQIDPAKPTFIAGPAQIDAMKELKKTINADPAKTVRANIIASLKKRGVSVNPNVNVEQIAASAEKFIMAPPVLSYTYWKKSA